MQIGGTMHSPINVVMKQQRGGAINKAYGHTQTGLQACSRSCLSAVLLARCPSCHPACLPTGTPAYLPAGKQAYRQAGIQANLPTDRSANRQALNIIWNGMGLKGAVLWIFDSKMGNKCTIMKRCSIFSIFQRDNFGNKE